MVLRMEMRWAEKRGFETELLEVSAGEEAGIKSATFRVAGENAYGLYGAEKGVHRLVRLSPFDSANRRQTSFAGVEVAPVVEGEGEVEISDDDLQVDTYRASGAGGQHVNKTDSAVRITHRPTGIVVQCQNERSQSSNKATAMAMLRAKLAEREERLRQEEIAREKGEAQDVNFGSQIRSYVLHPYTLVKDLRTSHETGDVQRVLDGDLDAFVRAFLLWQRAVSELSELVDRALAEDVGSGDVTSAGVRARRRAGARDGDPEGGRGDLRARAGAARVPGARSGRVGRRGRAARARGARPGAVVLVVEGDARALLAAERTALNFLARLLGRRDRGGARRSRRWRAPARACSTRARRRRGCARSRRRRSRRAAAPTTATASTTRS